jgi:hypothetical protein
MDTGDLDGANEALGGRWRWIRIAGSLNAASDG